MYFLCYQITSLVLGHCGWAGGEYGAEKILNEVNEGELRNVYLNSESLIISPRLGGRG